MQRERAQFVICFNLEYPFEPQLAEAAKLLKEQRDRLEQQGEIQPINNRALLQKAERYRTYLQVLDAEAAGAGIREMAQLLFPNRANEYPNYLGDRAVRDALRAAKRLRDDDYRKLTLREK
jgi:hypothetical protein